MGIAMIRSGVFWVAFSLIDDEGESYGVSVDK